MLTSGKTQRQINDVASGNFDKEMAKHKAFFKKHGIFSLIYTDVDLADINAVFAGVETYLTRLKPKKQLSYHYINDFFK